MSTNYKFTPEFEWFNHNIPVWEAILIPYFKDKPINAIEVGCFEGRATTWLLDNVLTHPDATIDCVDIWQDDIQGTDIPIDWNKIKSNFAENMKIHQKKVTIHPQESALYLKKRFEMTDLIYIDGDHHSHAALVDIVQAHMLLRPGGIIIFDDYFWSKLERNTDNPKGAIDAFMECFARCYEVRVVGYQVILQKNS